MRFLFTMLMALLIMTAASCTRTYTCVCVDDYSGSTSRPFPVEANSRHAALKKCDDKASDVLPATCDVQ